MMNKETKMITVEMTPAQAETLYELIAAYKYQFCATEEGYEFIGALQELLFEETEKALGRI
jgi:hypothetical protein